MTIRVNFYATFRTAFGQKSIELSLPKGTTVGTVLHHLAEIQPKFKPEILGDQGELLRHVTVFVSGKDVRSLQGLATPLPEGAVLDLFPPVAGG